MSTPPPGPGGLAASLTETLGQEHDALSRLHAAFDAQAGALSRRDTAQMDAATADVNEALHLLTQLRQTRMRQLRLLSKVLRVDAEEPSLQRAADALAARPDTAPYGLALAEARRRLVAHARDTQQRSEAVRFATEYALDLGRELAQALQGVDTQATTTQTYTAKGATVRPAPHRSLLNTTG